MEKLFVAVTIACLGTIVLSIGNFSSNLNTDPKLKQKIDHIMDSVHIEE